MTPKLILIFSLLTILTLACADNHSTEKLLGKSFIDTAAYPGKNFSSVTLFVLDSSQQTTISSSIDTSVLSYVGLAGYSFIDTLGVPKTKNYKSYELDSAQIAKLEHLLAKQPCTDSVIVDKACAPIFRNVFVFYDDMKKPIAQAHICFQCELSNFVPYEDYMCDFDNKINFSDLKSLVNNIRHRN